MLQINKFYADVDWTLKKRGMDPWCLHHILIDPADVSLQVPDILDMRAHRGAGIQPGEVELPDGGAEKAADAPVFNEEIVSALMGMGFPLEACQKAAYYNPSGLLPCLCLCAPNGPQVSRRRPSGSSTTWATLTLRLRLCFPARPSPAVLQLLRKRPS